MPRHLTIEEVKQIPKMRETMTIKEVADKFGVSEMSIVKWIKALRDRDYEVPIPKNKVGRPSIKKQL